MYSSHLTVSALVVLFFGFVVTKPLNRGANHPDPVENNSPEDKFDLGLPYEHYLKQVVEELEKDEDFKKKLETANLSDIKNGNIAPYLELVNHTIRSNLDELKRREIRRIQELAIRSSHDFNGRGIEHFNIDHLDKGSSHKFGVEDLRVLIKTATQDMEAIDEERRKEFKQHELEKEGHKRDKLNHLSPAEKKAEEERLKEIETKHKNHPKLHHPGSKDQMEEVWDKSDHFEDQDFDPKTFFMKHDVDGDMHWSIEEVDGIVQLELDKVYDPNNPAEEDDPWERDEEMNRMREHIMQEMDKDHNMFVSMEEFLAYTGLHGENPEFKKDDGWKTIDEEEPVYTEDELEQYLKQFEDPNQPGSYIHPGDQAQQQHQPLQQQQQQQFQPPQQQQQQQFQPPQQQQQNQPPHQQQLKFQQEQQNQHQQQFQPPQQQQVNQEQLQQQLRELQEKLNQQQQQQQPHPNVGGQAAQQGHQAPVGH